ncbi:MAG: Mur ligase family protein, partial [Acidobacteriota bacterium]
MTPVNGLRLDALLEAVGVELPGSTADWPVVTGVACDSRRVQPGDLFVAIVGERFDGRRFVLAAVEAGAVAILGPAPEPGVGDVDVPWVDVPSPRPILGALSARAFGAPGDALRLLGITGTNGKSTLVHLLGSMLDAAGEPAARLGTLGYFFGGTGWRAGGRTTPEAPDLHRLFAGMRAAGARAAAMEVSSHALDLGRVDAVGFDLAVFTNLSRDHLDFHGDMESYFIAKRRLFDQLKDGGTSVVHLEEDGVEPAWGRRLAEDLAGRGVPLVTCGMDRGLDGVPHVRPARAAERRLDLTGTVVRLETPTGELELRSPLLGHFHLLNLITAAACGVA